MKRSIFAFTAACFLSASTTFAAVSPIVVPTGMTLEKLPAELSTPRFLTFSKGGDMIVGSGSAKVYRLKAPYIKSEVLVDFGGYPHSVAFRETDKGSELWVGDSDGLYKVLYDAAKTYKKADFTKVVALPAGGGHSSRTVKIGPDNKVYVSLGIANNCSVQFLDESFPESDRRGGIYQLDESKSPVALKPYGRGLRNPIGFNWHPETEIMYADNNGPDHWGYDEPREVFEEVKEGSFFGMPWFQFVKGKVVVDTCAPADKAPALLSEVEKPVATFDARTAPMEVLFVGKDQLKAAWEHSALVALHGSWGVPAGGGDADRRHPKIVLVEFKDGRATGKVTDLLTGFQNAKGERVARPVGLAFGPDDALYFTSDAEGEGVYRLTLTSKDAAK
jgi:glucose/arabinose dehydrogenase